MKATILVAMALCLVFTLTLIEVSRYGHPTNARAQATDVAIKSLRTAVREYAVDCGAPPSTELGLQALLVDTGTPGWAGPYVRGESQYVFLDQWNNPLQYESDGSNFKIHSAGRDGIIGTDDDQDGTQTYGTPFPVIALILPVIAATASVLIWGRSKHRKRNQGNPNTM